MRKVNWKRGSATLLSSMVIIIMAMVLTVMYLALSDNIYANVLAMTRGDAIADAAGIYAQSYDYNYNKGQAQLMARLLGEKNNEAAVDKYQFEATVTFPEDNILDVQCTATTARMFPDLTGEYAQSVSDTKVKSVDIYGDVLVVPEEMGGTPHLEPTPGHGLGDVHGVVNAP